MNEKKITDEMRQALRADFPEKAYQQHPSKTFLTTLKAIYITERLNDVFGIGRWHVTTQIVERTEDYVLVKGIFESLDYEVVVPEQYGGHTTKGTNVEIADGYKSAVTDCISKIASYLEVGLSMFKGEIRPNGKKDSYKFGNPNDESLNWMNDATLDNMIKYIKDGKKADVIKSLPKYKWSQKNKDIITKHLDNE